MNRISETNSCLTSNPIECIIREIYIRLRRGEVITYLNHTGDYEKTQISDFLRKNISVFPYEYIKKYDMRNIVALKDPGEGLTYIKDFNTKIYMKKGYSIKMLAKRYYNNILIEQDECSPHRYVTNNFKPLSNDVIIDIGGAEGFFGLPYIDRAKKIYIFERDLGWVKALRHTYQDHMDKVHIIDKFVSNYTDDNHISLDDFIEKEGLESESIFIKIDAEGSEPLIIDGAKKWLEKVPKARIALCVYHNQNHEALFRKVFKDWHIQNSDGYMLYYYDYNFGEPYLRRGVLRITSPNA